MTAHSSKQCVVSVASDASLSSPDIYNGLLPYVFADLIISVPRKTSSRQQVACQIASIVTFTRLGLRRFTLDDVTRRSDHLTSKSHTTLLHRHPFDFLIVSNS